MRYSKFLAGIFAAALVVTTAALADAGQHGGGHAAAGGGHAVSGGHVAVVGGATTRGVVTTRGVAVAHYPYPGYPGYGHYPYYPYYRPYYGYGYGYPGVSIGFYAGYGYGYPYSYGYPYYYGYPYASSYPYPYGYVAPPAGYPPSADYNGQYSQPPATGTQQYQEQYQQQPPPQQQGGYVNVAPTGMGAIRIQGAPPDAQVYEDGNYIGVVKDGKLAVAAGPHKIEVRISGHDSILFDVNIRPDQTLTFRADVK